MLTPLLLQKGAAPRSALLRSLLRNSLGITHSLIWGAAPAPASSSKIGAGSAPCSLKKRGRSLICSSKKERLQGARSSTPCSIIAWALHTSQFGELLPLLLQAPKLELAPLHAPLKKKERAHSFAPAKRSGSKERAPPLLAS